MADETLKKLAEQFMNAGKSEEQRRRENMEQLFDGLFKAEHSNLGFGEATVRRDNRERAAQRAEEIAAGKLATRLVGCRACGQVNRVPAAPRTDGKKPACGACKAAL